MLTTRTLGRTDLQLTTIGLGTWAIGGCDWKFGWGPQDEQEAVEAILRGVELGINWIDTAAAYAGGRSEELVCKALAQLPSGGRPLIATKCGRKLQADGSLRSNIKRDSVLAECDASLRRLGIETIDLYQLHWPRPDEDIEEAWGAMVELLEAGKVRHIGVSNHSVAQMERLEAIHPIASLQPPYSMIVRQAEEEILPYCGQQRIGVVAYSPLYKGLLTGRFTLERASALTENDHRSRDPRFQYPQVGVHLDLVERLRPIASRHGRALGELAIAWVLRHEEVTSAIVGARRPQQIEDLIGAAEWELDETSLQHINAALAAHADSMSAVV